uniref:Uncharacterized protein n=1 Tax=Daphnia galeata TaxID=27404 RepID=A0A8J2RWI7_9CRUS|nr:unnamed protein product [Daphnia galeata]
MPMGFQDGPFKSRVTHKVIFVSHSNTCLIINLVDENGDEVRLNFWGKDKADKYVDKFEVSMVQGNNEEFPDIPFKYESVSSSNNIKERTIFDVIGIYYNKQKKIIPLQTYNKEEFTFNLLDEKGKKIEIGCTTVEQFLRNLPLVEMETIIGLKGVRLVRKGEKLECVTFADTIIEINPKCQQSEDLQKWMAADEEEGQETEEKN